MDDGGFDKKNENFYEIILMLAGMVSLVLLWKYRFIDVFGIYAYVIGGFLMTIGMLKIGRLSKSVLWKGMSWDKLSKSKKEWFGMNMVLMLGLVSYSING